MSLLDGASSPKEYMDRVKELGMPAIALTDHGTLRGHRDWQKAAQDAGVKPILGIEQYLSNDRFDRTSTAKREDGDSVYYHGTMIGLNTTGLKNLNSMTGEAYKTFYHKARVDWDLLEEYNEGIVLLSGCMSGMVAKHILDQPDIAEKNFLRLKQIFKDRFYCEVMATNPPELNHALLALADKHKVPAVMTSDCHAASKENLQLQEAMLILSTSPKPNFKADIEKSQMMDFYERFNYLYPDRRMTFEGLELYLRDYVDEKNLFKAQGIDREDIFKNTIEIMDRVEEYPFYDNINAFPEIHKDPNTVLKDMVKKGLKDKGIDTKEARERCKYELDVIFEKDLATYFIFTEGITTFARDNCILMGPGRGSAAGSLVCFVLGITSVNPLDYELSFERFLDPSRLDAADIDMDFPDEKREMVKDYLRKTYGHVNSISTFGRYGGKSAVRAAARVYKIPAEDVNRALKNNDAPPELDAADFYDFFAKTTKGREFNEKYPEVLELARQLHGRPDKVGQHPGGVVVSDTDLSEYLSTETVTNPQDRSGPRIPILNTDMAGADSLGLIKVDLLGLRTLSIIETAIEWIKERHGKTINPQDIPFDDKNTYKMISSGNTLGCFQIEQSAYTKLIMDMGGIKNFDELAASNALVRPGAAKSSGGKQFIQRKNANKSIYMHPDMKPFTKDTYGVSTLYQEQVMRLCTDIAGMTPADASGVRRGVGKKKIEIINKYRPIFINGAKEKVGQENAEQLWQDIELGAGYSFNKSHSVCYSILTIWTAWLKTHYPVEFMAALIKHETLKGDKDRLTDYLIEAKRMGIKILLPHVNKSGVYVQPEGNNGIRLGISSVKYCRGAAKEKIVHHAPYKSYKHLEEVMTAKYSGMNKRMLSCLDSVGAATFKDNPKRGDERSHYYEILQIPEFSHIPLDPYVKVKMDDIEDFTETGTFVFFARIREIKRGNGWTRVNLLDGTGSISVFSGGDDDFIEGEMYCVLVSGNRIMSYASTQEVNDKIDTALVKYLWDDMPEIPEDSYYTLAFSDYITKAGDKMAYLTTFDGNETRYTILFNKNYQVGKVKAGAGKVFRARMNNLKDGSLCIGEI